MSRIAQSKKSILNNLQFLKTQSLFLFKVGSGNNFGLRRTKSLSADKPSVPIKLRFRKKKNKAGTEGQFLKIYSDEQSKLDKAWKELETKIKQNIQKRTISDDTIKKITEHDVEKLKQLERDYDFQIKIDRLKREVKLKGHILDFATVLQKINEILKDIKDNEGQGNCYVILDNCGIRLSK